MRKRANWLENKGTTDMMGKQIDVGDTVVRAVKSSRAASIEICEVTKIDGDKVYLNDSKVAVWYPCRLLVLYGELRIGNEVLR